jgi:hypothetical protein
MVLGLLKQLGYIMSSLLLLFCACFVYILFKLPELYISSAYFCFAISLYVKRGDITLLKSLVGKKYKQYFAIEYFILAIPFILISIFKGYFYDILLCVLIACLLPLVPRIRINFHMLTNPFLIKGSYNYQSSFRVFFIFYMLSLIASIMGVVYCNIRILQISMLVIVYIIANLICQPIKKYHLYNYCSLKHFRLMNIKMVFFNTAVILFPFLIIYYVNNINTNVFLWCVKVYFITVLFFIQTECLRYVFSKNQLLQFFILTAVFFFVCASFVQKYFLLIQVLLALILIFRTNKLIKPIFK